MIATAPYTPWNIKQEEFPKNDSIEKQLLFVLRYAILAPSSHNTQPWKFRVQHNTIFIYPDYTRRLLFSDRTNRELFLSLGCSLGNIIVAAEYFNLSPTIAYFPDDDLEEPAVKILFKAFSPRTKLYDLFQYLTTRKSNRTSFIKKTIPQSIIKEFEGFIDEPNISIHFITDKKSIVSLTTNAALFAFNNKIFKRELAQWIRPIYTRKKDGITLFDFWLPSILTFLGPFLIRNAPSKLHVAMDKKMFHASSLFLVVSSYSDTKESWVKAGKVFEYIALFCEKHSISLSIWAGLIEHEESSQKLQRLLKIHNKPLLFARLGYAKKIPHVSPRRSLEEVLIE